MIVKGCEHWLYTLYIRMYVTIPKMTNSFEYYSVIHGHDRYKYSYVNSLQCQNWRKSACYISIVIKFKFCKRAILSISNFLSLQNNNHLGKEKSKSDVESMVKRCPTRGDGKNAANLFSHQALISYS